MSRRRALLTAARSSLSLVESGGESGRSRRHPGAFRMAGAPLARTAPVSLKRSSTPGTPPPPAAVPDATTTLEPAKAAPSPVEWTVDRGPALPPTVDADVLTLLVRDPWIILAFWSLTSKTLQQPLQDPLGNSFLPSRFRVEFWAREGLRFVTPEVEAHGDWWISVSPGTRGLGRLCAVAPSGARVPLFWSDLVETPRPVPGQAAALLFRDVNVSRETAELLPLLEPLPPPTGIPAPVLPPEMPRAARQWLETPPAPAPESEDSALRTEADVSPVDSRGLENPPRQETEEISALVTPPAWAASPAWKEWQAEILRLDALERVPATLPPSELVAQPNPLAPESPALPDLEQTPASLPKDTLSPFSPLGSSDLNPLRRS